MKKETNTNKIKENKMQEGSNKQIRGFEAKYTDIFGLIFNLPYNIGVVLLTISMWMGCFAFSYSSTGNFKLFPTIVGYLVLGSIAGIIYGKISCSKSEDIDTNLANKSITKLGIISLVLSMFMLIGVKVFAFQTLGLYVISPLGMFSFFVMLKAIWRSL